MRPLFIAILAPLDLYYINKAVMTWYAPSTVQEEARGWTTEALFTLLVLVVLAIVWRVERKSRA